MERDWASYNEELVVRGTFYLDFEFVSNWETELREMNAGKVGKPFKFPDGFIQWQAVWHQWIDYRGLEGIARKFKETSIIPQFDDYTTIWHRVSKFTPTIRLPKGSWSSMQNQDRWYSSRRRTAACCSGRQEPRIRHWRFCKAYWPRPARSGYCLQARMV